MFTKDLSRNVPLYGQEQCFWCGAASGQMAPNGYPNPADRLFYAQLFEGAQACFKCLPLSSTR